MGGQRLGSFTEGFIFNIASTHQRPSRAARRGASKGSEFERGSAKTKTDHCTCQWPASSNIRPSAI